MKKVILLLIMAFAITAISQNTRSYNGGYHTPKGRLHILFIFWQTDIGEKWTEIPNWTNEIIDKNPEDIDLNNKWSIGSYYKTMSNGEFIVTGEIYPELLLLNENEFWSMISKIVNQKDYSFLSDKNMKIEDFDLRTGGTSFNYDNSNSNPDGIIDYCVFIQRNDGQVKTGFSNSQNIHSQFANNETDILSFFTHEFAHSLYMGGHVIGTNSSNGDGQHYYISKGWGMMADWCPFFDCANAWERWWMNWITPQEITQAGLYTLADYLTENDAIKIKIPNTEDEYLWIENHQKKNIFDYKRQYTNAEPDKGLYMYISKGVNDRNNPEILKTQSSQHTNFLKVFNAEGNYDFISPGKTEIPYSFGGIPQPYFRKTKSNPIAGQNNSQALKGDFDGDGKIKVNYGHGNESGVNCEGAYVWVEEKQNGYLNYNYACTGKSGTAFQKGYEISLSGIVPALNYPIHSKTLDKLGAYYLNGLCIKVVGYNELTGEYTLDIKFDDFEVRESKRWCGDIILPEKAKCYDKPLVIKSGVTIEIDKSGTPNKQFKSPITNDFIDPTVFMCSPNSEIIMEGASIIIVDNLSSLVLDENSRLEIPNNATVIVQNGSSLILKSGAKIDVTGNGRIIIRKRGKLIYEGGEIMLHDDMSLLEINKGSLVIADNATFKFTGAGYIKLSMPEIIGGVNSKIELMGTNKYDKILEADIVKFPSSVSFLKIENGLLDLKHNAETDLQIFVVKNNFFLLKDLKIIGEHPLPVQATVALRIVPDICDYSIEKRIENCEFTRVNLQIHPGGTVIACGYGDKPIDIIYSKYTDGSGIFAIGSNIAVSNSTFNNNSISLRLLGSIGQNVISNSVITDNSVRGIDVVASSLAISNSMIKRSEQGVNFKGLSELSIKSSNVTNNNTAIAVSNYGRLELSRSMGAGDNNLSANNLTIDLAFASGVNMNYGFNNLVTANKATIKDEKLITGSMLYPDYIEPNADKGVMVKLIDANNNLWNSNKGLLSKLPTAKDYSVECVNTYISPTAQQIENPSQSTSLLKAQVSVTAQANGRSIRDLLSSRRAVRFIDLVPDAPDSLNNDVIVNPCSENSIIPCLTDPLYTYPNAPKINTGLFRNVRVNVAIQNAIAKMEIYNNQNGNDLTAYNMFYEILNYSYKNKDLKDGNLQELMGLSYSKMKETFGNMLSKGTRINLANKMEVSSVANRLISIQSKYIGQSIANNYAHHNYYLTIDKAMTYRAIGELETSLKILNGITSCLPLEETQHEFLRQIKSLVYAENLIALGEMEAEDIFDFILENKMETHIATSSVLTSQEDNKDKIYIANKPVQFKTTDISNEYIWDFGDCSTATSMEVEKTFEHIGKYNVKLNQTCDCKATEKTIDLKIYPNINCQLEIIKDNCNSKQFRFINNSSDIDYTASECVSNEGSYESYTSDNLKLEYHLLTGDGDSIVSSTKDEIVYEYNRIGMLDVTLKVFVLEYDNENSLWVNTGKYFIETKQIRVNEIIVPDFTIEQAPTCFNEETNFINNSNDTNELFFVWKFGDGLTSSNINETYIYSALGEYAVTLVCSNEDGCKDSITKNVIVLQATVSAGDNVSICEGESVDLTANGTNGFLWSDGSTTTSINITPMQTTTYTVTGIDENGCTASDDVVVSVFPLPVISAGEDVTITVGEAMGLMVSSTSVITKYLWSTGDLIASISVSPTQTTTYTVTATDENGCSASDDVEVMVMPQQVQEWAWGRALQGSAYDRGNNVAIDANGNVYAIGYYQSSVLSVENIQFNNAGSEDIILAKYNNNGDLLWARSIGGPNYECGYDVKITTDGNNNFYITGYFYSPTIQFGNITLYNSSVSTSFGDVFIVKCDGDGNVIWAKSSNGTYDEVGLNIAVDNIGNLYITGRFNSPVISFDNKSTNIKGNWDMFVVKYNSNGEAEWVRNLAASGSEFSYGVDIDNNGNVYVTGRTNSSSISFAGSVIYGNGNYDGFLVKYDANGNELWGKLIGGSAYDIGDEICTDEDGNVYLTGYHGSSMNVDGINLTCQGSYDIYVIKYSTNGNVIWARRAGGNGIDYSVGIAYSHTTSDIFVGGYYNSSSITFGGETISSHGGYDMLLLRYDKDGNEKWMLNEGSTSDDYLMGFTIDECSNLYVTGSYTSPTLQFGNDILTNFGDGDMFVAKYGGNCINYLAKNNSISYEKGNNGKLGYDRGIDKSKNTDISTSELNIYPNPTNGEINIEYSLNIAGQTKIIIYDVLGNVIKLFENETKAGKHILSTNLSGNGVYLVKLISNDLVLHKKVVKR